ncbi:hypothetical protein HY639_04790 [Candidatus Woesearchaeota archaeon]|nr:hypothetical protein [Candidatus Woesearchaeota archaeon]
MLELVFVPEGPYGYLIEKEPISVAVIPARKVIKGLFDIVPEESLLDKIILPPEQAKGIKHAEIRRVRGRRLGRTLDILLDKPIVVNQKEYRILTFKGCGAIIGREWGIDPFNYAAGLGRLWGAVLHDYGLGELQEDMRFAEQYGLHTTPYLSANVLPTNVLRALYKGKKHRVLVELLRLCQTNILPSDILYSTLDTKTTKAIRSYTSDLEQKLFSSVTAMARTCRALYKRGKMLNWTVTSDILSNMYISGELKDFENFRIGRKNKRAEVVCKAYHEMTTALFDTAARTGNKTLFVREADMTKYIFHGGRGPVTLRKPVPSMPNKVLHIPEYQFAIVGFARKGGGVTWNQKETYHGLTLDQALELNAEFKDGSSLATRRHFMYAEINAGCVMLEKFIGHHFYHTLSTLDATKQTIHDYKTDGTIVSYQLPHQQLLIDGTLHSTKMAGWYQHTAWPRLADDSKQHASPWYSMPTLIRYSFSSEAKEIPIGFGLGGHHEFTIHAEAGIKLLPLVIYTYQRER